MLIPSFSHDGVLPPFLPGVDATSRGKTAPYRIEFIELVRQFGKTHERREILKGLVEYRKALRAAGITSGFQWIDGSFVEDCERVRGRPPNDVDLITFSGRPDAYKDSVAWHDFIYTREDLFDQEITKAHFKCDAYFVDLSINPALLVAQTRYWFGLFSHQRDTYLWKGMVEVPIGIDDKDAEILLQEEKNVP